MGNSKIFISLVVIFILGGIISVIYATNSSASKVMTPTELSKLSEDIYRVRVAGRVVDNSISYSAEQASFLLKFQLGERKDKDGTLSGEAAIPVTYENIKPDMFKDGRDVLVDGDFVDGEFLASSLLTQCPSKYEPPQPKKGS